MKFYTVSDAYLKHIKKDGTFIYGIPLRINSFLYILPFRDPDATDFDEHGIALHSPPFLFRLIHNDTCVGKLVFSDMFPAPYGDLKETDCHSSKTLHLIELQLKRIEKSANRLYNQKIRGYDQPYLLYTNDFTKLEHLCIDYEKKHYGSHINRFPDHDFFITQPDDRITFPCTLCNRNTEIALLEYNRIESRFSTILSVKNEAYAPLECLKNGHLELPLLNRWLHGRGIPSLRDGLQQLLFNLNIQNPSVLLSRAFGLSLSDQYWLKPENADFQWEDINFFENDFRDDIFPNAVFDDIPVTGDSAFFTPDNTSDGMLKKAWIIDKHGTRQLLKGSFRNSQMEPLCEVLATMIAESLNLPHVPYSLIIRKGNLLSSCPCFITPNTELITAWAILKDNVKSNSAIELYNIYVRILEDHSIRNVREHLAKMFILDYLIVNTDRHLGNFGIIRNVNDLFWSSMAPVFDSGMAMFSQKEIYRYDFEHPCGTFFNEKDMDFDQILSIVTSEVSLSIPFERLLSTAETWKDMLNRYADSLCFQEDQIEAQYKGLLTRIQKLKDRI